MLFNEHLNMIIKQMIVPIFYKTLVWFYTPAIDPNFLNNYKEQLIIILTQVLVSDSLADQIITLNRFNTFKEEIELALKSNANLELTLDEMDVPKLYRLNQHL